MSTQPTEELSLDKKYKILAGAISESVLLLDFSLRPIYMSPSTGVVRGYTPEEVRDLPINKQVTSNSQKKLNTAINELLEIASAGNTTSSHSRKLKIEFFCKDGSTLWREVHLELATNDHTQPVGILAVLRNIHQEDEIQNELQSQMNLFEEVIRNAPIGICILNKEGKTTFINREAEFMLGFHHGLKLPDNFFVSPKYFKDIDGKRITKNDVPFLKAQSTGDRLFSQTLVLEQDEGKVILSFNVSPIIKPNQVVDGAILVFEDITERYHTRQSLYETQLQYFELFNSMNNPVSTQEMICNDRGEPIDFRFVDVNASFEKMAGLRRKDIIGKRFNELFPTFGDHWIQDYYGVAYEGKSRKFFEFIKQSGKWIDITAYSPIPGQFVTIFEEVTNERLHEIEQTLSLEINQLFSSARDITSVCAEIPKLIAAELKLNISGYESVIEGQNKVEIWLNANTKKPIKTKVDAGQSILSRLNNLDRLVIDSRNTIVDEGLLDPFLQNDSIQTCIALPVRYQGSVTGAIILADSSKLTVFNHILDMLSGVIQQVENHIVQFVTEKELEQSEIRFRAIFENAASGIALLTPKGVFIQTNPALASLLNKSPNELLGSMLSSNVTEAFRGIVNRTISEIAANECPAKELEIQFLDVNGNQKWGLLKFASIHSDRGDVEYVLAMMDDISDGKKSQEVIALSNARLQALEQLNQMYERSTQDITEYTMEEAVRLTKSSLGYIAFVNKDETVMTMYSWSKEAMKECVIETKPIVYKVEETGLWGEAVRQRKPVITNDYQGENPAKKGYPKGHVHLIRHMNVPIFDGDHIVVVAGVGNKSDDYDESDVRQLTLLMSGMWNILQRKESLEAIRKSEEHNRMIVNTASEGIWTLDLDNRSTFVNQRMAEILGCSVDELINHQVQEFIPEEDRNIYQDPMMLRKPGEVDRYEIRMVKKDGTIIWCLVSATNMVDSNGMTIGSIAMLSDVSQRKLAEEQVKASRKMLQLVLDTIPQRVFWKDKNLNYLGGNRNFLKDLGFDNLDDLIGRNDFNLTRPELAESYRQDDLEVMETDQPKLQIEEQQLIPNGDSLWTRTNKVPLHDENGNVDGVLGTYEDITAYREARKKLVESEERFRNLAENAPVGIYETDLHGVSAYINERWKEITGVTELTSNKDDWTNGIHPDDKEHVLEQWDHTKTKSVDLNMEYRRIKPNGSVVWVTDRERPFKDQDGKIRGFIGTITDITELKHKEQEIRQSLSLNQATLESTESGILAVDMDGRVTIFNQKLFEIWGLNLPEHGFDHQMFVNQMSSHFRSGVEYAKFLAKVKKHPLERSWQVLRLKNGKVIEELSIPQMMDNQQIGRVWSYQDVTSRYVADEQLRRNYEDMQQMVKRLGALRNIDTAITGHSTFHEIVSDIMPNVTSSLSVDAALLLIPHLDSDQLLVVGQDGFNNKVIEASFSERMVSMKSRFTGKVFRDRNPMFLPIANKPDPDENPAIRFGESFASYAAIPLIAKDEVKGVLEVFSRKPMNIARDWKDFFHSLAMQVAIAIDNADLFNKMEHTNLELLAAYEATIEGWARALELRDKETLGHSERVIDLTLRLASVIGIPREQFAQLRRGVLLHDIGKMGVPDSILLKPGPLSQDEWVIMRQHPTFAYEMLSGIPYLREALDVPYSHHERWDGTGYPQGLSGESIPLSARIFSIVDVWDALTSKRPYRPAWREQDTKSYIRDQAGKQFDPQIVEAFLRMLE